MSTLKNKYQIGDKLWAIFSLGDVHRVMRQFDCEAIWRDHNELVYSYQREHGFYEINLFASEEEAQTECDRRNARAALASTASKERE